MLSVNMQIIKKVIVGFVIILVIIMGGKFIYTLEKNTIDSNVYVERQNTEVTLLGGSNVKEAGNTNSMRICYKHS